MSQFYKPITRLNRETNKKEKFIAIGQYVNGRLSYVKIVNGMKVYGKYYIQVRNNRKLIMILDLID